MKHTRLIFLILLNTFSAISARRVDDQSLEYFVSKTATNIAGCGTINQPCPTLFDASNEIGIVLKDAWWLYWLGEIVIHVIDGQNEDVLTTRKLINSIYNPCLPIPLNHTGHLIIKFDASIHDSNDWFPLHICSGNYTNSYMFYSEKALTLYNLIINDYTTNIAIAYTSDEAGGSITCDHCIFTNIISTYNNALFSNTNQVSLLYNTFQNIELITDLVYIGSSQFRKLAIDRSQFINIKASGSLFSISNLHDDVVGYDTKIWLNNTIFDDISIVGYIITDHSQETNVIISDTIINMITGSIYYSNHIEESDIHIKNISVSSKVSKTDNSVPMFYFEQPDHITTSHINVLYLFDVDQLCDISDTEYHFITNAPCLTVYCHDPHTFIMNVGKMEMTDTYVDIKLENEITSDSCVQYIYYGNWGYDFIFNLNQMYINDMFVVRSMCDHFLFNEGIMQVHNLSFGNQIHPTELQSRLLLFQYGQISTVAFYDSYFFGASTQIFAYSGSIEVVNCLFEHSNRAIYAYLTVDLVFSECIFRNHGHLYGVFASETFLAPAMLLYTGENANITDNIFSGYNPAGFIIVSTITSVYIINNTFINTFDIDITDDDLFYDLKATHNDVYQELDSYNIGIYTTNTKLINNHFMENSANAAKSWIKITVSSVCITGNTFLSHFAFHIVETNVTSCFRPQLMECAVVDDTEHNLSNCSIGLYGYMDASLFYEFNTFVLDDAMALDNDDVLFIYGDKSIIALDNVNIISNKTNNSQHPLINITNGHLLLVDAYITSSVLSYNVDGCTMIHKEHLQSNVLYISRLLMNCDASQSMLNQNEMKLVNHLSVTNINISCHFSWYYPGDLLTFEYRSTDRLHNLVDYGGINTTVYLQHASFLGTLNIESSKCRNCETGLLLSDVSLNKIGDTYEMDVAVENIYFSTYSTVSITILGCPIGYSPDNNYFHCKECATDYYNPFPNNTKECIPCNPSDDINHGIECSEGNILIAYNYWVAFDEDHIHSLLCPHGHCCTKQNGCDYIQDKDLLCAKNRDYNVPLCGKCKKGFSESLTSINCIKCKKSVNIEYFLFPFALSFILALIVLVISREKPPEEKKEQVILSEDMKIMLLIMVGKCMMYYEQAISEVLTASTLSPLFNSFASLFNFSFMSSSSDSGFVNDICLFDGMDAKYKLLIELYIPIMISICLLLLYIVPKYILKRELKINGKIVIFSKACLKIYLLMIGKILDVLFKLLSCTRIHTYMVHDYFGYEKCFGITWIIAAVILAIIMLSFAALFMKLRKLSVDERRDGNQPLQTFASKYKRQYYWWEFVIFVRRIIIALFAAMTQDINWRLVFVTLIMFYAYLQQRYKPFVIHEANNMEFILLCCLIFIIVSQFPYSFQINELVISGVISFLIVFPIPLILYYVVQVIRSNFGRKVKKPIANYDHKFSY